MKSKRNRVAHDGKLVFAYFLQVPRNKRLRDVYEDACEYAYKVKLDADGETSRGNNVRLMRLVTFGARAIPWASRSHREDRSGEVRRSDSADLMLVLP